MTGEGGAERSYIFVIGHQNTRISSNIQLLIRAYHLMNITHPLLSDDYIVALSSPLPLLGCVG